MVEKFFDGQTPAPDGNGESEHDRELLSLASTVPVETAACMDRLDFSGALTAVWRLVNRANKYIDETMPWALAKDPSRQGRLAAVLYNLVEVIRIVTVMISPVMPTVPAKVWAQIGADPAENAQWEAVTWGGTRPGQRVAKTEGLFPRIENKENDNMDNGDKLETKNAEQAGRNFLPEISIEDFARIDLRVAEVIACEKVEKADKLLKLELKTGEETRTVVAGVAKHYSPAEMIGRKVILVANLKPAQVRGITSQGMILAASQGDTLEVLTVTKDLPAGSKVK